MKYLQENKLPFPFIIQLANPERILHYTKEEVADVFKRYLYTYEKDKSEKQLERIYKSTLKNWCIIEDKAPIFKPSQRKINSLIYCYDAYTWDINIPTQAEVQYLYNQICLFNKGILGQ